MNSEKSTDEQITMAEYLPWAEFVCWIVLLLAPILYYVNGPSVSTDQFVVRTTLVVVAAASAGILRMINWRRRKWKCSKMPGTRAA